MQNLLLIGPNLAKNRDYMQALAAKQEINPNNIYEFGGDSPLLVEEFREILKLTQHYFKEPSLFVIYNFHLFSNVLQNTFLKTLEEHQENIGFVLVANKTANILDTIKSRCQIKVINPKQEQISEQGNKEISKIVAEIATSPRVLISTKLKLFKNKKEKVLDWLNLFIRYGYFNLKSSTHQLWLCHKLKRSLRYYHLIETNNLDPELTLDNIFIVD